MVLKFLQPKSAGARLQECSAKSTRSEADDVAYVDNELVRRVRQGDVGAFEELFNRHQKRVYNIALRVLNDETEAADATQEIFVKAYQSIDKLSSNAAFVTWLKTLAVNLCRDVLRKRGAIRTHSLDAPIATGDDGQVHAEVADWSGNPEMLLGRKETRDVVARAIDSLSAEHREVVTLFYVDGSSVADIAAIVGSPVGTVKARLSRARAELRRKLGHYVESWKQ